MLNPFETMVRKNPTPLMDKMDFIGQQATSWQPPSNSSFASKMEGTSEPTHTDRHRSKLFG